MDRGFGLYNSPTAHITTQLLQMRHEKYFLSMFTPNSLKCMKNVIQYFLTSLSVTQEETEKLKIGQADMVIN